MMDEDKNCQSYFMVILYLENFSGSLDLKKRFVDSFYNQKPDRKRKSQQERIIHK
jgi:hypothetical protein